MDREIKDPAKVDKILKATRYVTIALSMDNRPYLVSLSHSYDINSKLIYFHCASARKKLDYMKSNPNVWGQAIIDKGYVEGKCNHHYVTAMFSGTIELVTDITEKRRIMNHMFANQEKRDSTEVDSHFDRIRKDSELINIVVGKIMLHEVTGKISKDTTF
jgi:nitroimidazol reductase NimA-like FMN-containing flavoprotein (pyridoxamine 5'-phosphate oxidase superfamily)